MQCGFSFGFQSETVKRKGGFRIETVISIGNRVSNFASAGSRLLEKRKRRRGSCDTFSLMLTDFFGLGVDVARELGAECGFRHLLAASCDIRVGFDD
jgi:hypothetical protein